MKYIYILLFFIISTTNVAKASEISERWDKQVASLDQQKQVVAKNKAQSIGDIYTTNKDLYIRDTININDISFGQLINYIKNGDKTCAVSTADIINVLSYDTEFDAYMKLITYGQKLKIMPGTAKYYDGQQVSCLRIVGCRFGTNNIQDLVNNTAITNTQLSETCKDSLPKLYYTLYQNNEKYYYLTRQRIGNEIYMNGDETDASFDILADIKYIGDAMYWSNQDPSSVFLHDLKRLKTENTKLEKIDQDLQNNTNTNPVAFDPENQKNKLTLLAQTPAITPITTDLFDDPDIQGLLGGEIYGQLVTLNPTSKNSFIRSYVNKITTSNTKQNIAKTQQTRESNNPISNDSDSMTISNANNTKRTTTLKDCLKACISAKSASDVNFCRNSCLCGQIPKDTQEKFTGGRAGGVSSLIVIRYCTETVNSINLYDPKNPQTADKKKQTVQGLSITISDFLQTINEKDITPRNISTENFDFDIMFAKFWKEFDFSMNINTIRTPIKYNNLSPDLINQPDKINSDTQNPSNTQSKKSLADVEFFNLMKLWIDRNVVFWENMQKVTNNLKQTTQELRGKINQ